MKSIEDNDLEFQFIFKFTNKNNLLWCKTSKINQLFETSINIFKLVSYSTETRFAPKYCWLPIDFIMHVLILKSL